MDKTPRTPFWLTIAGLIPFLVLAQVTRLTAPFEPASWFVGLFGEDTPPIRIRQLWIATYAWAHQGLIVYAGVILAFLAGIRWGSEMHTHPYRARGYIVSVLPPLAAAGLVTYGLQAPRTALYALAVLIIVQYIWDWLSFRAREFPQWFAPARLLATIIAGGALLYAANSLRSF